MRLDEWLSISWAISKRPPLFRYSVMPPARKPERLLGNALGGGVRGSRRARAR